MSLTRGSAKRRKATPFTALAVIGVLALQSVSALAEEVSSRELQRQIVEALAAGRDAKPLLDRLKAAAAPAASPLPNRSIESHELQQRLNALRSALDAAVKQNNLTPQTLLSLLASYEAFQAAHLLFEQRFVTVQNELARGGVSAEFEDRRRDAQQAYEQVIRELNQSLDPSLGALQRAADRNALLQDTAFRSRSLTALRQAQVLLAKLAGRTPAPILRADTLPFRQAKLAQRAPKLSPTIQPSYLTPQELAVPALPADTAATVDAPLSEEILQQAKSLDYDYIRIYEFVRNEIRGEWYAGAMKGAVGTLRQKSGNDVDQASLLIALFRASGLPARYVHGVVELPIEDVMNSLGLADAVQATTALARAGIAYSPVIRGGRVAAVNVEHTWVSAYVPYTNYRGAVVDVSGKTWLPLLPALKRYDVTASSRAFAAAGLSADGLLQNYLQEEQTGDPLSVIRLQVTDYLQAAGVSGDYNAQLGASTVAAKNLGLLPNTLPLTVVAVTGEGAELADAYRQRLRFIVRQGAGGADPVVLDYTVPVSEVASERVTLSYIPATVDDHKTVNLFGGLDYVPAYLIKLRPQIKINGRQKAVAEGALDAGMLHRVEIQLLSPLGTERVEQTVTAGGYHAIGVYAQQVARRILEDDPADTEHLSAKLLDRIAYSYTERWNQAEAELAGLLDVAVVHPRPTLAIAGNAIRVDTVLGRAMQLQWQGVTLDAALRQSEPIARDGSAATAKDWMRLAALEGSALEHQIFEDEFLVDSLSADKGLRLARAGGLDIVQVTAANSATVLPTLSHPAEVKTDIENWVRLGMTVDVPRETLTHNAWSGSVWRVDDPVSGAAGYFIAGGLAGGATTVPGDGWLLAWLRDALMGANTSAPNPDPLAGASITKIYATEGQQVEVGKALPTNLAVLVRDSKGNPVVGAAVEFRVAEGGGKVAGEAGIVVPTNFLGIAEVPFELGQKTSDFPVYIRRNPGDEYVTQAGLNLVDASVLTYTGILTIATPFSAIGVPQEPTKLQRTNGGMSGGGFPNLWADTLIVQPQDLYDNPVSNVDITVSTAGQRSACNPPPANPGSAAVFDASQVGRQCPSSPILGECGSGSVSLKSDVSGVAAGIILGNAAGVTYDFQATGAGSSLLFSYTSGSCAERPLFIATSEFVANEFGDNVQAAKPGERVKVPIRVGLLQSLPIALDSECRVLPDRQVSRVSGVVTFSAGNGGTTTPASGSGGIYQTFVTTGPSAGPVPVAMEARQIQYTRRTVEECRFVDEQRSDGVFLSVTNGPFDINLVYGVEPTITDLVSGGKDPSRLFLNENGQSEFPAEVRYNTAPAPYVSLQTDVDFFEDGQWWDFVVGTTRSGAGAGRVPRGASFDLDKSYEAQIVVNRGSEFEIKSEKFPLPISQRLFKDFTRQYRVSQDVDVLNSRVCTQGNPFEFTLTQPATVTLTFTSRENSNSTTTIIDGEHFEKGTHSRLILPAELRPGEYTFELNGVSDKDGHEETENGVALSEYETQNRLPVGHVLIKGVDLFDGGLATGSTDLEVAGRGAALEFRRTYGSNSSAVPGRLGVGWAHNYDSKVIITPCGEAIVIGGEGGGMRFVEDGQGGLRPLKGYHGTLIPNHTDRTFDFYSKDGTRYHYRNFGTRAEWNLEFIEDNNGNVTRFGYDPTSTKVAKLVTVEDAAKRTLKFEYEDRLFFGFVEAAPVITRIEGPDGIAVTFEYDDRGNLITARRESDARVERYAYSVGETLPYALQHKLTSYTNPNGAVTTYTYNAQNVSVTQGVIQILLPYSFVEQVREPEGGITRFQYDLPNHVTRVTDGRNNVTTYTLNQYGSPLTIQDPVSTTTMTWAADDVVMTSKTDGRGVRTDYTYDTNGNVLTETVDGKTSTYTYETFAARPIKNRVKIKTDRNGRTTTYGYDARGNLVSMRDPENGETRHTYAANGDRLETRDPNGNTTRFTYDTYGNVATATDALGGVTETTSNVRSLPTRVRDPLGRVTRLAYDTLNRLTTKTDPAGGVRRFTYDAVGNKLTETDEENRVTTWTYDKENRVVSIKDALDSTKSLTYDAVGNKTSETDWKGNSTSYEYDAANRLITRTEPLGKVARFTYDDVGNVLTEADALARITRYEYDALNRRTKRTDARDGVTEYGYDGVGNKTIERDPLGRTVSFVYDGLDRLTQKTEPLGRITKYTCDANGNRTAETDPNGNVRRFAYDALNRPVKRTDAEGHDTNFEYDAVGNLTVEINPRLFRTRHAYDALNRRISTTDPEGAVTTFGYDKVGNRTTETWPNGNDVTHVYDGLNRLRSSSDDLGQLAAYEYDANGNRTREVDANGNVTVKTYDALNRYTQTDMPEARTMTFEYDLIGNKTAETDPNGNRTRFAYDALNRLERITDPFDKTVTYTYDAVGNRLTETDKRSNVTRFEYDDLNRPVKATDALNQVVTFTYDLVGNKKSETDKRGTVTEYLYDKENRPTRTVKAGVTLNTVQYDEVGNKKFDTDANGNISTYIYDGRNLLLTESRPLAAITNYQYDSIGNRAQMRDPENRITRYTYDVRRRMLTEVNGENQTTTYTYDANGNRLTVQRPKNNTWTSAYDGANRLTRITDPLTGATRYTYDKNGNRLTQVDANDHTTAFEYDALNRQTAMVYADGARAEFRYDENGNRIGLTDAKGLVFSYAFDALNRETTKSYPLPNPATGDDIQSIVTEYDPNGNVVRVTETYTGVTGIRVTNKSYDPFDRLIDVTDAFGKAVRYQYDANGNRTVLTDPDAKVTRYTYDALNRVSAVTNAGGATTYEYDRSSLLTRTTYPNGTNAATTFDRARRQLTVTNRQGTAVVSSYVYTYDANGNRATQVETNGGTAQTTTYTYDANDRLTNVAYPDKTTTYTYDAGYNRLTERTVDIATAATETDKTYSYNTRNQLTGVTDAQNSANSATYGYDANGNQTIKTKNGVTTTFVYDVRDQLISVQENATTLGFFRYDYQGMRVVKDMGGQVLRYTYDDKSVLLETDTSGTTVAKFDYGPNRLLSLTHATEGRQFYLFDALGSVSNLTTPAGAVQARYQYDAFGNFRAQAGASFNRFAFTGHEKDNETGLYYFKARFYDPDTGRFLSHDPYLGDVDTPPSLHSYLYAYANPLVYVDLEGYESVSTMIDNAAEGCGAFSCAGWALLKAAYHVGTLGFASVHDPVRDAYDEGKISGSRYVAAGIGGGLAVTGINLATARVGGTAIAAATTASARIVTSAAVGAVSAAASDAATQGSHIAGGIQEEYDLGRTGQAAAMGAAVGGGSATLVEGATAARQALAARASQQGKSGLVAEGPQNNTQIAPQNNQRPSSNRASPENSPAETQASKTVPEPPPAQTQAPESSVSAQELYNQLPQKLKSKTVATAHEQPTMSGYKKPPEGYADVTPEQVLKYQQQIGHPAKAAGAADQGVKGQYFASHAERKQVILDPEATSVSVSRPMCKDCQAFYSKHAESVRREVTVTDPAKTRVFRADGTVVEIPRK